MDRGRRDVLSLFFLLCFLPTGTIFCYVSYPLMFPLRCSKLRQSSLDSEYVGPASNRKRYDGS